MNDRVQRMLAGREAAKAARARGEVKQPPKVTRASAIRAKCKDCIYDPIAGGTWLDQVDACDCRTCPLWPVRPVRRTARENPNKTPDNSDE